MTGRVPLEPGHAVALWSDLRRWPSFVEGFSRLVEADDDWPAEGARVVWESGAGGRGRVSEKVRERSAARFATRVAEDRLVGLQAFRAEPSGADAEVELSLEYELARRGPLAALTDFLFIRRALRDALARTLRRYTVEAQDDAGLREHTDQGPVGDPLR